MNKRTATALASMREQRLDVKIGIIDPTVWVERLDAIGVATKDLPTELAAFRAWCVKEGSK